jgi:hypothetical protein
MTTPDPNPAMPLTPEPPDEFRSWLDCALSGWPRCDHEDPLHREQWSKVCEHARAELDAERARHRELVRVLREYKAAQNPYVTEDPDDPVKDWQSADDYARAQDAYRPILRRYIEAGQALNAALAKEPRP